MHTQGQAIEFIRKVFGDPYLTNAGLNANVVCPVCIEKNGDTNKKKLAIRTDNWLSHCWVCGYKSRDIYQLVKRYKAIHLPEYQSGFGGSPSLTAINKGCVIVYDESIFDKPVGNEKILSLPVGFQLLAEHFYDEDCEWFIRNARNYLVNRGLTYRDFWYFKFGVTDEDVAHKSRVIFPSFDAEGNLNYHTSRSLDSKRIKPKYLNPGINRTQLIFNELNIDWTKELTLVEGPFDLVKCNYNATCVLGSELGKDHLLFQKIVSNSTPVLLAFDDDAMHKTLRVARRLTSYGITVRLYQLPEERHDVGEMNRDEFISLIPNAKLFTMEESIRFEIASI